MIPEGLAKPIGGLVAIFAALGLIAWSLESCERAKAGVYEVKASEAKGRADEHAKAGAQADASAAVAGDRVAAAEANVERLKRDLAEAKRRLDARNAQPRVMDPLEPVPAASGDSCELVGLVAKQDQVIQAQDAQIQAMKAETITLTQARDEWRAAFRAERDRADGLYLALEAQKAAAKGTLWKGRIQGLAVGFAAGYVAGRVR